MRTVWLCRLALVGLLFVPVAARADDRTPARWAAPATLRWNEVARALVRKNYVDPLWAARTYAMVGVAQYDAVRAAPRFSGGIGHHAALVEAAVAASSATTLAHLYPHEVPRLSADLGAHLEELRKRATPTDALERAAEAGRSVARALLQRRADDGADRLDGAAPPTGAGVWHSSEEWPPLRPFWGEVRPFLVGRLSDYDPPPPPAAGSEEFGKALAVVREFRRASSFQHESIALKWADGPGTSTPVGHWNEIAVALMKKHRLGEAECARLLAYMNTALMDASILCWRTKFKYWLMRPPQADSTIVPSFALPNFPSYPSGHASFSAAASVFLAHRFPGEKEELYRLADEAARSRVVSGLHYPFDCDAGVWQGRRVAETAIALYESDALR
jgi:hypothetical protein